MGEDDLGTRLIREFLAAASASLRAALSGDPELTGVLLGHLEAARGAWPKLELLPERFARYLAERVEDGPAPLARMQRLHGEDLYLACACAAGVPGALVQLDRKYLSAVAPAIRRVLRGTVDQVEDVQQQVRQRLLVAEGGRRARLLDYKGRGPLGAWIRSAAVHTALNRREAHSGEAPLESGQLRALPVPGDDQELALLKARCKSEFKAAFEEAVRSLSGRDREVLRLSLVENLKVDEIGEALGIPRSTAGRWLVDARTQLSDATRRVLASRLKVEVSQLQSVMGLVRSQLSLSVYRHFGES